MQNRSRLSLPIAASVMLFVSACTDEPTLASGDMSLADAGVVSDSGTDASDALVDATPADAEVGICGDLDACDDVCVDTAGDNLNCGACGTVCGDTELCLLGVCSPFGPVCADRILGSVGAGVTIEASTAGMGNDIDGLCGRSGANDDTTFFWEVPVDGRWEIRFGSGDFDVVAGVGASCGGGGIDCDDDGNGRNGALLSFQAVAGQRMVISVDAFRGTGSGRFSMSFNRTGE